MKKVAVWGLCAVALLSSCTPPLDRVNDSVSDASAGPVQRRQLPLPPGAQLDPPGVEPEEGYPQDMNAFSWPGSLPPGSDEDRNGPHMNRIRERGRLIVGVDQSQYLLSYRDATRGDLRGFEVDLAHEIARDIFGDPDALDFRFVDSASRTSALQSGDVDIVIRTMSITPERAEVIDFSTPYLNSYVRVLVPRDRGVESVGDLPGKTICVADGTNVLNLVRERFAESEVLRTRSWSDCLMALQQFQADAVVGDDSVLAGMVAQDPLAQIFADRLTSQRYAVGVPKGHDDVVRQVNFTIERIRGDGTWSAMYNEWLERSLSESWLPRQMYRSKEDS